MIPRLYTLFLCLLAMPIFAQTSVISSGQTWKYLDNGTDQGTAWRGVGFNDAS